MTINPRELSDKEITELLDCLREEYNRRRNVEFVKCVHKTAVDLVDLITEFPQAHFDVCVSIADDKGEEVEGEIDLFDYILPRNHREDPFDIMVDMVKDEIINYGY